MWRQHQYTPPNTDPACAHVAIDFFSDVVAAADGIAPEYGSHCFNVLDWVTTDIRTVHRDGYCGVVHDVVCVNPANERWYGRRARVVGGSWHAWHDHRARFCAADTALAGYKCRSIVTERLLANIAHNDPHAQCFCRYALPLPADVRARAHDIWQRTSRDDATANWLQAERELRDAMCM